MVFYYYRAMTTYRKACAEFLGTAFLLAAVVGSGIMGERLADGNDAIALLANSLATGVVLAGLIVVLGPVSGAHFNPVVTLAMALRGELSWKNVLGYAGAQLAGAFVGVSIAHLMFELPAWSMSRHDRAGASQVFSEAIATFGLILMIFLSKGRSSAPLVIAGYIVGAYWFTSSTCFANPAVTLARAFTDTFAGITLQHVPAFIAGQLFGAIAALATVGLLQPSKSDRM